MNPLVQLQQFGQSPWYDYIRRGLLTSGELNAMIDRDGLLGVTSNPSIFEKAIGGSTDYDPSLKQLAESITGVKEIYETLAIQDIQDATDLMKPVYEKSGFKDGYVSLEVSPHLAHDTQGTIKEALRLHQLIGRENVMIKVPATPEGIPAIERLLSEGVNVNVTLLFSVEIYEKVAWAYISGLEKRMNAGEDVSKVSSVASFFVSRIDSLVDSRLEDKLKTEENPRRRSALESLMGKIAIANAKMAYLQFQKIFSSPRFRALQKKGARVQRLLWASTGTKNPKYPDTYYVEALIGPDTVNTMPAATFNAFRDHGRVETRLTLDVDEARAYMALLLQNGIDMGEITQTLLAHGVRLFAEAFEQLMGVISQKRKELLGKKLDQLSYSLGSIIGASVAPSTGRARWSLPLSLASAPWIDTHGQSPRVSMESIVKDKLMELRKNGFARRLWSKDPTLWHSDPEHHEIIRNGLGWMHIPEQEVHHLSRIKSLADSIRKSGFDDVVLLGMGGSSLCPEVCRMTFGVIKGYPELHVLDSTVPAQVRNIEKRIKPDRTLFIVSSKSGSTTEPLVFYQYFYDRMRKTVGDRVGEHFIGITDPGSQLEDLARKSRFREILPGVPDIGGRYSALSHFGIVPAAIMGINVEHFLYRAERMRHSCDSVVPPEENPGIVLGVILGEMASQGRDKVTFITSPAIHGLGAWLEQLIAESTGKEGKGLIPIDGEGLGPPESYGNDRLFVYIRYAGGADSSQDWKISVLEKAGHPIVRIELSDLINLGEEFFLWEIATAVAGSVLGVNAFDQPNVQESKDYTKAFLEDYEKNRKLPEENPILSSDGILIYGDDDNRQALKGAKNLEGALKAHMARVKPGDYVALNAYVEHSEKTKKALQNIRIGIRDTKKVATTIGYGPRFLHSTGQLHKGGPNSGVFIQITSEDSEDLAIPGETFSFGILKAAQALGDFLSLSKRKRRAIRIHLGKEVEKDLGRLEKIFKKLT